jgi:hypothetical protein
MKHLLTVSFLLCIFLISGFSVSVSKVPLYSTCIIVYTFTVPLPSLHPLPLFRNLNLSLYDYLFASLFLYIFCVFVSLYLFILSIFSLMFVCISHRYLMSRLRLQVFYVWRHVLSTAPLFILWWWNLEIPLCLPPRQLSLHKRAALSSNSNGTQSVYSRKNPKSRLYCEISMVFLRRLN